MRSDSENSLTLVVQPGGADTPMRPHDGVHISGQERPVIGLMCFIFLPINWTRGGSFDHSCQSSQWGKNKVQKLRQYQFFLYPSERKQGALTYFLTQQGMTQQLAQCAGEMVVVVGDHFSVSEQVELVQLDMFW